MISVPNKSASERIAQGKQAILDAWLTQIREEVPAASDQKTIALKDAIPAYLDSLVEELHPFEPGESSGSRILGQEHGSQRWHLDDYSLFQVIFEYRVLRQVVLRFLDKSGGVTNDERDIILDSIQSAMGHAAAEFAKREVEVEKKARERAETAEVRLKAMNENLTQFSHIVAHDLREPLRVISTYVSLLEKKWAENLDEETREHMAYAADGAKKMQRRIESLLALSQLDAPVEETEVSLKKCVENVLRDLSVLIKETKSSVKYANLPTVRGNEFQLAEVFQNLIENSIKFRSANTPVIDISHTQDKDFYTISVKDNGIGFPAKYADHIFMVFKRLNSEEDYQGTGMGLSICKKIVERHGGKIWAESAPGEGSTFFFRLPMSR